MSSIVILLALPVVMRVRKRPGLGPVYFQTNARGVPLIFRRTQSFQIRSYFPQVDDFE